MEMPRQEEMMKLEAFSLDELRSAMRYMKNRRCTDKEGLSLEQVKYGPEELHVEVLRIFNQLILEGHTHDS